MPNTQRKEYWAVVLHHRHAGFSNSSKYVGMVDILTYWNRGIQNSIKDDTRDLTFRTASLFSEEEFLIELGTYEVKKSKGILKNKGKYLVVWKQEDGNWKLYGDIGL